MSRRCRKPPQFCWHGRCLAIPEPRALRRCSGGDLHTSTRNLALALVAVMIKMLCLSELEDCAVAVHLPFQPQNYRLANAPLCDETCDPRWTPTKRKLCLRTTGSQTAICYDALAIAEEDLTGSYLRSAEGWSPLPAWHLERVILSHAPRSRLETDRSRQGVHYSTGAHMSAHSSCPGSAARQNLCLASTPLSLSPGIGGAPQAVRAPAQPGAFAHVLRRRRGFSVIRSVRRP